LPIIDSTTPSFEERVVRMVAEESRAHQQGSHEQSCCVDLRQFGIREIEEVEDLLPLWRANGRGSRVKVWLVLKMVVESWTTC